MRLIPFDGAHGVVHLNPYAISSVELGMPDPRPNLSYDEMRGRRQIRVNMLSGYTHFSAELGADVAENLRDDFLRRLEAWGLPEKEYVEFMRTAAPAANGSMGPCGDEEDDC